MGIRAKMRLSSVVAQQWGGAQAIFSCEYDNTIPEDQKFQVATPSGMAQFTIDNPAAINQLVIGKTYYFDITPVDPPAPAAAAEPEASPTPEASPALEVPAPADTQVEDNGDSKDAAQATQG